MSMANLKFFNSTMEKHSYINILLLNLINLGQLIHSDMNKDSLKFNAFRFYKKMGETYLALEFTNNQKEIFIVPLGEPNDLKKVFQSIKPDGTINSSVFVNYQDFVKNLDNHQNSIINMLEMEKHHNPKFSDSWWLSDNFGVDKRTMEDYQPILLIPYIGNGNTIPAPESVLSKSYHQLFNSINYYAFNNINLPNYYSEQEQGSELNSELSVISLFLRLKNNYTGNPNYPDRLDIQGSDDGYFESQLDANAPEFKMALKNIYELIYTELTMLMGNNDFFEKGLLDNEYWDEYVDNKHHYPPRSSNFKLLIDILDILYEESNVNFYLYEENNQSSKLMLTS